MRIITTPKKMTMALMALACLLIILHIIGRIYLSESPIDADARWVASLFDVDRERSFPTLFSYFILQFAALLLGIIAYMKQRLNERFVAHWWILCAVFAFLSFDEALSIHENFIKPTMSWVVPYLIMSAIFALSFLRFLLHLPSHTRNLFIASGLIYVFGAAGLEIPGGQIFDANGGGTTAYRVLVTIEESFEMTGIILFIYTLTSYMGENLPRITIENGLDSSAALPAQSFAAQEAEIRR